LLSRLRVMHPRSFPVFSRKPIWIAGEGRERICMPFIGMRRLAHHMFTLGMNPSPPTGFFVFTTMAIAVPTGIKIFNCSATMWGGKIQFKTPMLFCIGFPSQFLLAGLRE